MFTSSFQSELIIHNLQIQRNYQFVIIIKKDMEVSSQKQQIIALLMSKNWSYQKARITVQQNGKNQVKWTNSLKSFARKDQLFLMKKLKEIIQFQKPQQKIISPLLLIYENLKNISIKLKNIQTFQISTIHSQTNKITAEANLAIENNIKNSLQEATSIEDYFRKQINPLIEILQIRGSLLQYYNSIVTLAKTINNAAIQPLRQMTFVDFIILLQKVVQPNDTLIFLLSKEVSIPIVLRTSAQLVKNIRSCSTFLGFQNYSLILNLGTKSTQNFNRTNPAFKIMNIPEKYVRNTVFQNLDLQRVYSPQKKTILADVSTQFKPNQQLLTKFYKETSLLLFHATEEQINKGVLNEISLVFQSAEKFIIFIWDDPNFDQQKYSFIKASFKEGTIVQITSQSSKEIFNVFQPQKLGLSNSFFTEFKYKKFNTRSYYNNEQAQFAFIQKNLLQNSKKPQQFLFPKLSIIKKIRQLKTKINNEGETEQNIRLKTQLQISFNSQVPLKFIDSCRKYLRSKTQSFNFFLSEVQKYSKVNPQITIDNIIQQLSIFSQSIIDKLAERPVSDQQNIINNFYKRCFDQLYPCNIIERLTYSFGNKSLERFLMQVNQQFKKGNKKSIYIVSVIGLRGEGKSNLLNNLFRNNLYVRETTYVQGVYVSLCEIDNKIIVLFDVEGMIDKKNQSFVFEHQIAAFIMKVSNLVLITHHQNKLNTTKEEIIQLKETLQISKKFFNNFQEKDYKKGCSKVFLALQIQDNLILQRQVQSFKNIFKGFIDIVNQDIFAIPTLFKDNAGTVNENYGAFILNLKSAITDYLFLQKFYVNRSILQFYKSANTNWEIIVGISKNLFQCKTVQEANLKLAQLSSFKDSYKSYKTSINAYFAQRNEESQNKIKKYFASLKNSNVQLFLQNEERSIKKLEQFVRQFKIKNSQRIKQLYNSFYQNSQRHYKKQISDYLLQRKYQFSQIAQILLNTDSTEDEKMRLFQADAQEILQSLDVQYPDISVLQIRNRLARVFQIILESQTIIQGLSINHINNCVDLQDKIQNSFVYNIEEIVQFQLQLTQEAKGRISNIIRDYVQKVGAVDYQSQIDVLNRFDKAKIIANVQELSLQINSFNKNAFLIKINYTAYLFGFLFKKIVQTIKKKSDTFNAQNKNRIRTIIEDKRVFLKTALRQQKDYIQRIKTYLKDESLTLSKRLLFEHLDQKIKKGQQSNIVSSVLNETIKRKIINELSSISAEELQIFYKKCYKFVKNQNRFIDQATKRLKKGLIVQNELIYVFKQAHSLIQIKIASIISNPEGNASIHGIIQQIIITSNNNFKDSANNYARKLIKIILEKENTNLFQNNFFYISLDNVKEEAKAYIEAKFIIQICHNRCQICGAPCSRKQPHNIHENEHYLEAFGGIQYEFSQQFNLRLCRLIIQPEDITNTEDGKIQIDLTSDLKTAQIIRNQLNIWANIQQAIIWTKYKNFLPSTDIRIINWKKQKTQLTVSDLQATEIDQEGKTYYLKDY